MKVPSKIKVGFQKRSDTYTGMLGFVITNNGKTWQCEKSWNGWIDKKIPAQEYDNVPTSGFVLNKKVGGYKSDWNYRQSYIRVYDPRGFELEITPANLLNILEYTNSVAGKGLEGDFFYVKRNGKLWLQTVKDVEFQNTKEKTQIKPISTKEYKPGMIYVDNKNRSFTYLGFFDINDNFRMFSENKISTIYYYLSRCDETIEFKHKKYHIFVETGHKSIFTHFHSRLRFPVKIITSKNIFDENFHDLISELENSGMIYNFEKFVFEEGPNDKSAHADKFLTLSYKKINDFEYIQKNEYLRRDQVVTEFNRIKFEKNIIIQRISNVQEIQEVNSGNFVVGNLFGCKTNGAKFYF